MELLSATVSQPAPDQVVSVLRKELLAATRWVEVCLKGMVAALTVKANQASDSAPVELVAWESVAKFVELVTGPMPQMPTGQFPTTNRASLIV
jgi:hypothetical protein